MKLPDDNDKSSNGFFLGKFTAKPEHAWLKPVAGAHIGTVRPTSRVVFYLITFFLTFFLVWAWYFEIDEYVHAQGHIEPEGEIKTLSHFEGGVIENIFVKEGDVVAKGQVLLQLKDVSAKATFQESLYNFHLQWAERLRLKAQIREIPLVLPQQIQNFSPRIYKEVMEKYQSRMAAYLNEKTILQDQLVGLKSELTELRQKIINLTTLLDISRERTELLSKLLVQNLLAKTQYLQSRMDTTNRTMDLHSAQDNVSKVEARIKEGEDKLAQVKLRYDTQDWQELKDHEARYLEAKKIIVANKDRVERTDIRSPVYGIIKQLFVHTIGAAVTSGKELISIVPIRENLLIEVNVLPQDIGFIRVGYPATIKVTAYDYSIYGSLKGTVKHISPDAVQDPRDPQRTYYKVQISTEKNSIEHNGKVYTLIPGETVQADIVTSKRTVMQYLMKPIAKSLSDSLRER
jgi:membrane fusion protein, adhesin transport system